jgi:glycosyltransferase involved in cell wall biosynthesis
LKLIIQIPAFNEEKSIQQTLRDLPRRIDGVTTIETLLIDDGSTDRTVELAREAGVDHVVRLISNRGLAAAFTAGIDASLRLGADLIVNTDGDNQYRGSDIARLVAPLIEGKAEVVIGDRQVATSPHMGFLKRLLQRLGSWTVGLAAGIEVSDATSGLRAFTREAAFQINVFNPFTYTLETIIQAGNRNLNVSSVAIETNAPTRSSRLYRGIHNYIRKSVVTIFRVYTLYKPLKTFFAIGGILFAGGFALVLRFLYFYLTEGTAGHIQSLILAAVLLIAGFQTMLIGLVADLISVNRRLSEEVLIRLRKLHPEVTTRSIGLEKRPRGPRKPGRPKTEASPQSAPAPEERKPYESQWVWLVDEAELEAEADVAVDRLPIAADEQSSAPRRRRRRRRNPERPTHAPREHRHHQTDGAPSEEN